MSCGEVKLSKYLTQTFMAHYNAMICQQVTLSGDAEWPKVADAVIEARHLNLPILVYHDQTRVRQSLDHFLNGLLFFST